MKTDQTELERFIVRAKAATYVGDGRKLLPYRLGTHDLQFHDGDWAYHDSYVGQRDFLGEELVYYRGTPVWAMNYYGYILRPDLLTGAEAGRMIKASLSRMYLEGRFLGGFTHTSGDLLYTDESKGSLERFTGREQIARNGTVAYELVYHGGMVE